jgi:hypothetical protein
MKIYAFRILPGKDLKVEIERFVKEHDLKSAFILSCVGGLSSATVRMAGASPEEQDIRNFSAKYEIVSLVGTLSQQGAHIHISISDSEGLVTGGHLKDGSIVGPTAEVILGEGDNMEFSRALDSQTGFEELVVQQ